MPFCDKLLLLNRTEILDIKSHSTFSPPGKKLLANLAASSEASSGEARNERKTSDTLTISVHLSSLLSFIAKEYVSMPKNYVPHLLSSIGRF